MSKYERYPSSKEEETITTKTLALLGGAVVSVAILSGTVFASETPTVELNHRVEAGETAWGLAQEARPSVDPREALSEWGELNPNVKSLGELSINQVINITADDVNQDGIADYLQK